MSEIREFGGKTYRKVNDGRFYRCIDCCFYHDEQCHSPGGDYDVCRNEYCRWEEVPDNANNTNRKEFLDE